MSYALNLLQKIKTKPVEEENIDEFKSFDEITDQDKEDLRDSAQKMVDVLKKQTDPENIKDDNYYQELMMTFYENMLAMMMGEIQPKN